MSLMPNINGVDIAEPIGNRRAILRLLVLLVIWSAAASYVWSRWQRAEINPLTPLALGGEWITTAEPSAYSGYFRTVVLIPGRVKHAWVAVSADNAFELTVNGNPAGRLYMWRPSRPFQTGLSEDGQRLVAPAPALGLNFPREYQWTDHDNSRLPVWLDIAGDLQPGRNVLCVEIEARHQGPRFKLAGMIELWSGEKLPIGTNRTWRGEPVPRGMSRLDWTHRNYLDSHWRIATAVEASCSSLLCAFDERLFQRPFAGTWIKPSIAASDAPVWFRRSWDVSSQAKKACLRVLANRTFEVFVNGRRLGPPFPSAMNDDSGNWMINERGAWDDFRHPELVNPEEIGSMFIGNAFLSPRHGDPTYDPVATYKNQINVTTDKPNATNRSDLPGTYDPKRDIEETRRLPTKPDSSPVAVGPRSLERDRGEFAYYGYDVTALLQSGSNTVEVRLAESTNIDPLNWPAQIAVDGIATSEDDSEFLLQSDSRWTCAATRERPTVAGWEPVQEAGPALTTKFRLPRLTFQGIQRFPEATAQTWLFASLAVACATIGFFGVGRLSGRFHGKPGVEVGSNWMRYWSMIFMMMTALIGCAIVLEISFAEREEALWSLQAWSWKWLAFLVAFAFALAAAKLVLGAWRSFDVTSIHLPTWTQWQGFMRIYGWTSAVHIVVLGSFFLRAYELDTQPMDDDEYASVQGVLAIAQTGVPGFVPEGVFYSRSPAYHYLTGAIVAVFGQNIWALRLPSILFGSATVWLTYWAGSRLLGSRFVGLAAMVLMALHPYEIFTSHVARFYQQQQFFALLTIYWFCKGFVTDQLQSYRYLTVAAFFITVLSQELAIVLGPVFLVAFLLFGRDLGWVQNARLIVVCAVALGGIFLDWAAFQTLCLSRLEGVSPNFEATLKPHFWQPFNLFSLFIGYSRLHLSLTVFIGFDLFFGWRKRPRAFLALFVVLVIGVVSANLLVTHSSLRYQYFLFPIWAILGVDAMRRFALWLVAAFSEGGLHRPGALAVALIGMFFVTIILSGSPWRLAGTYNLKILPDSTGACQYVASNLHANDKVMVTEPHPHAAFLEIGHADFDLSVPILMDFVILKKGKLIDRNAGAEAVGSLVQLQGVLQNNDRVWILINKEKLRTRGKNIRWEYPAARIDEYLRQNTELKYRTPFWYVYLWDKSSGRYRHFAGPTP